MKNTNVPAALWTGPFLKYLLVEGCSHDWDHTWPAPAKRHFINSEIIKREIQLFRFVLFT